jgi:tRNA(fMet)-specific endonuclease VapC
MIDLMLDTNACIQIIRDKPRGGRDRFIAVQSKLAISSIVLHELQVGLLRSYAPERHAAELAAFLPGVIMLDFDEQAAIHAADIKAKLLRSGNIIGPNDLLIAGHARSINARLITSNLREFSRVDGLRCEDWLASD